MINSGNLSKRTARQSAAGLSGSRGGSEGDVRISAMLLQVQTCCSWESMKKTPRKSLGSRLDCRVLADGRQSLFYMTGSVLLGVKRQRDCWEPPEAKNASIVGFIYRIGWKLALSWCFFKMSGKCRRKSCEKNYCLTDPQTMTTAATRDIADIACFQKSVNRQTSNGRPHYWTRLFLFTGFFCFFCLFVVIFWEHARHLAR